MDNGTTTGHTAKRFPSKQELLTGSYGLDVHTMDDLRDAQTTHAKPRGTFIVFEGGEGSGKSTQAKMLSQAFAHRGIPQFLTREPGGTDLGKDLRSILVDRDRPAMTPKTEALLFAADRAEHVVRIIEPALERGTMVICDRYRDSSMAYQAYAGGLEWQKIDLISEWASDGLRADVTYFLDVEPAVGLKRARANKPNRFEEKELQYHKHVRNGFLEMMNLDYVRVDGEADVDSIHQIIINHAINFLWRKANPAVPS